MDIPIETTELVSNRSDGNVAEHDIRDLHFRALISARDDLYPLDYMCEPDFDLSLD